MHPNKRHSHIMKILALVNTQNSDAQSTLQSGEYHSALAHTICERRDLIESGFKFLCEMERVKVFSRCGRETCKENMLVCYETVQFALIRDSGLY